MDRTTPVSSGWMTLVRPLGTIFPVAEATVSMVPQAAQPNAVQNSRMMTAAMARPSGDGGVSTISSAAGRKARSLRRLSRACRKGIPPGIGLPGMVGSVDFMNSCLQPMQRCIAAACLDQRVVSPVFHQPAALERDDAIHRPHGRQSVRNDQYRPSLGNFLHIVLDD